MKLMPSSRNVFNSTLFALLATVLFTGCSTPFKYNPKHDQHYSAATRNVGIAIVAGEDARLKKEKRPRWKPAAEEVVANALSDELKYANLFQMVRIDLKKRPEAVQDSVYAISFRV